jgi:glycosyltransferase involved in cell wall biosynthesis
MNAKVSIVVPVYRVENYIERCARSLFGQTYHEIEYIFIDDASDDNSIGVLNKTLEHYPERIKQVSVTRFKENGGVGFVRSTGLSISTGDYILFADPDDYLEPDMVELMINKAILEKADMVFCSYFKETEAGDKEVVSHIYHQNKKKIFHKSFQQPALWNKMFKRSLVTSHDIYFPKNINYGEDLAFIPRIIFYADKFAAVDKPLYHYMIRSSGSYTHQFNELHVKQTIHVIDFISDYFKDKTDFSKYKRSLNMLKAIRKAKILRSGMINHENVTLFPEIKLSFITMDLDLKTKFILLLAALRMTGALQYISKHILKNHQK